MKHKNKVPDFMGLAQAVLKARPAIGRVEAMKWFKDSFILQGFNDNAHQPWIKTKSPLMGKRTLLNTNALMNGLRVAEENQKRVIIVNGMEYAGIHNEGGFTIVTEKMKKYFWWQYRIHSKSVRKTKSGRVAKGAANQSNNAKANFCKAMALKPVGSKIKIPQRKFMGNSRNMMRVMDSVLIDFIKRKSNQIPHK
ncbi:MAG: hypothetical protein N4A71_02475 [Carboxylicivirga sp.]|jgi:phage gpG-like protein|nr:hypothetical protein [Carboxylicivirga sp.]